MLSCMIIVINKNTIPFFFFTLSRLEQTKHVFAENVQLYQKMKLGLYTKESSVFISVSGV